MVLYIGIAAIAAWWYLWSQPVANPSAATALTLTFSSVFAIRILLMSTPWGYAIFYDGPAILSILMISRAIISKLIGSHRLLLAGDASILHQRSYVPLVHT